MRLSPCLVGMEYTTRWTAYTLRIPVSFFNRAGRLSHITAWHVSDGGSGHPTPAMPSLASMSPSLKRASLKPYMSSLMGVPVQASRADGRFPCDLDVVQLRRSRRQNPGETPTMLRKTRVKWLCSE